MSAVRLVEPDEVRLFEPIGSGSFGSVFRGEYNNKEIAVKKLPSKEKEASILAMLDHPNIIEFYGACEQPGNYSILIEFARYGSLYSFLQTKEAAKLDFEQMIRWALDIARGVNYLHNEAPCKVIHRDLKSKNVVIVGDDYTLKLCDFGASRYLTQTATMTMVGTFPWMAPELIQGKKSNDLCDVYSFGVLLWEMLTREVPFKGMEGFQVAWMVVEKRQRPVLPEKAPEEIKELISTCWAHDPKDRKDFKAIILDLEKMELDQELMDETNSFMGNKEDWEEEYEDLVESMRTEQHSSIKEREEELEKKEMKMKEWEDAQREAAKNHGLINIGQIEETSFNRKFKFTGKGEGAAESIRGMLEAVSGRNLSNQNLKALTRGSSGSSLAALDDKYDKYSSNTSLSSTSSTPGTVQPGLGYRHKRSVGTPPADKYPFSPLLSKHMVQYSPKKHSCPRIEGEAEFGGSTRKTSLGLLGNTQTGESGVLLPKELEEILNAQSMGKPFCKFSRQTSTSNETISYNEARAIIKGPEGTEPRVIENASGDYSKSHSSDNLTLAGKDSRGLNLMTNMSPCSSTANMTQFNTVTCNSPEIFQPGYSPNEERLQQKVGLLQQQVKLLEQELKNILNKPKRGVRVQVNCGPITRDKSSQTDFFISPTESYRSSTIGGSPPDSFKSNISNSSFGSGHSTICPSGGLSGKDLSLQNENALEVLESRHLADPRRARDH
ncbi:unnamed protein product [Oikopleura dioica]|uniref:Protein kinase domain-containing protein n=1 Tax=Oikopleura dioica TaxID=34765 RepID=E4YC43_OIKDI|nr:unnamed protein product [Oikopleura dioica]